MKGLGVLICTTCRAGLDSRHIFGHMKTAHNMEEGCRKKIEELVEGMNLKHPDDVVLTAPGGRPVPNVKVYDGWGCTSCAYAAKDKAVVKRHIRSSHPKDLCGYQESQVQTLFKFYGRKLNLKTSSSTSSEEEREIH